MYLKSAKDCSLAEGNSRSSSANMKNKLRRRYVCRVLTLITFLIYFSDNKNRWSNLISHRTVITGMFYVNLGCVWVCTIANRAIRIDCGRFCVWCSRDYFSFAIFCCENFVIVKREWFSRLRSYTCRLSGTHWKTIFRNFRRIFQ